MPPKPGAFFEIARNNNRCIREEWELARAAVPAPPATSETSQRENIPSIQHEQTYASMTQPVNYASSPMRCDEPHPYISGSAQQQQEDFAGPVHQAQTLDAHMRDYDIDTNTYQIHVAPDPMDSQMGTSSMSHTPIQPANTQPSNNAAQQAEPTTALQLPQHPIQIAPSTLPYQQPTQSFPPMPCLAPNMPDIRGYGPTMVLAPATDTLEILAFYQNVQGRYEGDPNAGFRQKLDIVDYRAFVETAVLEHLRALAAADAERAAGIRAWLRHIDDSNREGQIDEEDQL